MKRFVLFVLVVFCCLLSSCSVKYKEVTLDDGTRVFTVDTDDPLKNNVVRLANTLLDEALAAPEQARKDFEEVNARIEKNRAQMDKFEKLYFPELCEE